VLLTGVDESELISRSVGGDESAYQLLVEQHLPSLSGYVMRMMANAAEAEDIIQETFIRLWTHGYRYRPGSAKLTTWLHNIAHNLCIDYFRKHNRLVDISDEPDEEIPGPENNYAQHGLKKDIQDAMMAIPERQRSAIIMCHYQGLSNKDAAIVLGITVDALESLMVRGRKKLRSMLTLNWQNNEY
jgi:RNA polymerase sigma-70 factor, ECF subfamily